MPEDTGIKQEKGTTEDLQQLLDELYALIPVKDRKFDSPDSTWYKGKRDVDLKSEY